jgi:putative aldouronate transport system permease protein
VVSTIMLNIFGENGVLNSILGTFGIEEFSIYQHVSQWPIVMVLVKLWKQTGYGTVVYLAAIAGISQEMTEAAQIDGASVWQRIRYITIPSLKPTIIIMTLLAIGNIFRGDFGMFYQLVGSNQLLLQSSDVIDTYVYRSLITTPNIGMSAAAGLYQSVLCFVTICAANYIVKKVDPDYTLF